MRALLPLAFCLCCLAGCQPPPQGRPAAVQQGPAEPPAAVLVQPAPQQPEPLPPPPPSPEPTYQGAPLSYWLRQLEDSDMETAGRAAKALKAIGPRAVPGVLDLLGRPSNPWAVTLATELAASIDVPPAERERAIATLRRLRDNNPNPRSLVRVQATKGLARLGAD